MEAKIAPGPPFKSHHRSPKSALAAPGRGHEFILPPGGLPGPLREASGEPPGEGSPPEGRPKGSRKPFWLHVGPSGSSSLIDFWTFWDCISGCPRSRKSCSKIVVERSFETTVRKKNQRSLAQWPVLGALAPLEIRPLSRSGSKRGRDRRDRLGIETSSMKTPNVTAGNSPKSPPPGSPPLQPAPPPKRLQNRSKIASNSSLLLEAFLDRFGTPT